MAEVAERLRSRGFGVYLVPEAATMLFTGGGSITDATDDQVVNFQTQLMRVQMVLEDCFIKLARASSTAQNFVLVDRGICDGRAYMKPHLWQRMLRENNLEVIDIRDSRYDLVVHLVTAADGAPEFYSHETNKQRSESPGDAIKIDQLIQNAWLGTPYLRIVDNRTGFREKINRVDAHISELAGLHLTRRIIRKFLLLRFSAHNSNEAEEFNVEQTFLRTGMIDSAQESVRKRGKAGFFTYLHKVRRSDSTETKRHITVREYTSLLAHKDRRRGTVRILRQCFLYCGNYFVLDHVLNVRRRVSLLRCHCEDNDDGALKLPEWVDEKTEVTNDKKYSMHTLSLEAVDEESECMGSNGFTD